MKYDVEEIVKLSEPELREEYKKRASLEKLN